MPEPIQNPQQVMPAPVNDSEELTRHVVGAIQSIAAGMSAIYPIITIQALFDGTSGVSSCPGMDANGDSDEMQIAMDYGTGCSTAQAGGSRLSGAVRGIYYPSFRAFDVVFHSLSVEGIPIVGTAAGSFQRETDGDVIFAVTYDLQLQDSGAATGTLSVNQNAANGELTVTNGTLTLTEPSASTTLSLEGVFIEPGEISMFRPSAGRATVNDGNQVLSMPVIWIQFTDQTSLNGSANYSEE